MKHRRPNTAIPKVCLRGHNNLSTDPTTICAEYTLVISHVNDGPETFTASGERLVLPKIDSLSIHLISKVLAQVCPHAITSSVLSDMHVQSVSLDSFERKVAVIMDELRVLNHRVEARGEIGLRMRSLFRTIAKNNLMLAEVVNHLGLLDT